MLMCELWNRQSLNFPSNVFQLWTPLNVILFNLVCSDFSVSVLGNPLTMTASIRMGWDLGQTLCVAYGFFMSLLGKSRWIQSPSRAPLNLKRCAGKVCVVDSSSSNDLKYNVPVNSVFMMRVLIVNNGAYRNAAPSFLFTHQTFWCTGFISVSFYRKEF